ncbi:MAG TPA: type II secretion system protein [Verrucomicrobiae bacterium]|nr:type II secretion system protein [Verrucomicrobiae bacterium]
MKLILENPLAARLECDGNQKSSMIRQIPVPKPMTLFRRDAFTLIELLVVVAIIGILAALLLPALIASKAKAQGIGCQSNNKNLVTGWIMYADDHSQVLPNNYWNADAHSNANWVAGLLDWEADSDNTNLANLTEAALGPYVAKASKVYRCPSDWALSSVQRATGWSSRARSYSMNAQLGDVGVTTATSVNANNPGYVQFFKLTSIQMPARIFVFVDEHPDSISDGYFWNHLNYPEWIRLPASWHNGAASFSFADGHTESHSWRCASTMPPSVPDGANLPIDVSDDPRDFNWVAAHMSVPLVAPSSPPPRTY